ncbi:hypothetical protein HID58_071225 [Brassica napus]|uniref:S-protein homolog n=1 Tax=Brassica napus TaxID=3708 RepID=A0ABQ7Z129_BRANA|nr:hypothetical protein HID58_071225 [Brassica napus]
MTRVDLNVLSSFAADMESDPSVTINGLKPLSFRHRDGSTQYKLRCHRQNGDRHFDYRIYGDTIISLTVSSSSALLKHSFETEGMVECNYDATSKITWWMDFTWSSWRSSQGKT